MRGNAVKLPLSVVRERHGKRESVPNQAKRGIAEATASSVVALVHDAIGVVCVDDPDDEEPGHALVAMVVTPGDAASQEMINVAREMLALKFRVVLDP
ncbi:MAG: hypothetical protein ABSC94_30170 [Polyangiaceae bacterium]|jgi:hypothetical protein